MSHARVQPLHLVLIHLDEASLRADVLIGLLLEEKGLHQLEEAIRVKFQKPGQELGIGSKPHDIIDIDAPLKGAQGTLWELFTL